MTWESLRAILSVAHNGGNGKKIETDGSHVLQFSHSMARGGLTVESHWNNTLQVLVRAPGRPAGKHRPGKGNMSRVCGYVETLHRNKSLDLASYSQTRKSSIPTLLIPVYGTSPNSPTPSLIPTSFIFNIEQRSGEKNLVKTILNYGS